MNRRLWVGGQAKDECGDSPVVGVSSLDSTHIPSNGWGMVDGVAFCSLRVCLIPRISTIRATNPFQNGMLLAHVSIPKSFQSSCRTTWGTWDTVPGVLQLGFSLQVIFT